MKGLLYLEDGTLYIGKGFGARGTSFGELVFNTSITGYQEILTDPSYAGQVINMTYPLIGNYGVNRFEYQSSRIYARGMIVKTISSNPSNYMSEDTIDSMLKNMGITGICDVDTRGITKKIRECGALKCVVSTEDMSFEDMKKYIEKAKQEQNLLCEVSTKKAYNIPGDGFRIALIDFGVKKNIIDSLIQRECDITVFPYDVSYDEVMAVKPQGVLLSNGPGNPEAAVSAISLVKRLMYELPVFGICLGHQILALASGGSTYKMKYGHRGGNHGVYDIEKDRAYITSQNHGYAVDAESINRCGMVITHKNLNDGTVEGMKHKDLPVFSVQFHPEGAPGPTDSSYLFDRFISYVREGA